MTMISGVRTWWADNVSGTQLDYGTAGGKRVWKSVGIGAGVGTVAGGAAGGINAHMDKPYVAYVSKTLPLGETGPKAESVFGADHARLLEAVRARSSGAESAARSIQYLAYMKNLSPGTSPEVFSSLFNTVENHFSNDDQARSVMNLVAACLDKKPGSNPYDVFARFLNDYHGADSNLERGSERFMSRCGLTQDDLKDTIIKMELRHTTLLGRFGLAGGILIGAGAGAVVGAGAGAVVGVLWNAIARD